MIAKVWTAKFGVKNSDKITIEIAKTSTSLPRISLLGIPASEAIASKERVLTACRQAGIRFPHAKITINLHSHAKIAKSSGLEFAIAVGLMQIHDLIPKDKYQVLGGLSLDGNIEPVEGHYSALQSLAENSKLPVWVSPTYLPVDCQAAWSRNLRIVNDITEFLACATGKQKPTKFSFGGYELMSPKYEQLPQMVSPGLANCLQLVLSGGHHCLLLGAPGVGKNARQANSVCTHAGAFTSFSFAETIDIKYFKLVTWESAFDGACAKYYSHCITGKSAPTWANRFAHPQHFIFG